MTSASPPRSRFRRFLPGLPYVLIVPTAIFVVLFTAWPTVISIYQSFFLQRLNIARFRDPTFIGLDNYTTLFADDSSSRFWAIPCSTCWARSRSVSSWPSCSRC